MGRRRPRAARRRWRGRARPRARRRPVRAMSLRCRQRWWPRFVPPFRVLERKLRSPARSGIRRGCGGGCGFPRIPRVPAAPSVLFMTPAWHATPAPEVAAELAAGPEGLTSDDARERLARYGPNRLPEAAGPSAVRLLADQLRSPLMWALLLAAGLALALGEIEDCLVVLAVVILNTLIGFAQEYRAGRAIAGLAALVAEPARVRRDGVWSEIPADDVVPGDLVEVAPGDRVAADLRLLDAAALRAQEAALTGELERVEPLATPLTRDLDRFGRVITARRPRAPHARSRYRGARTRTRGRRG